MKTKRIGIFTKMEMVGGSEFRAVELANGLSRSTLAQAVLLVEREIPPRLLAKLDRDVELHSGVFSKPNVEPLYSLDNLVVINSDSRLFTSDAYWLGHTEAHGVPVEMSRIPNMTFLFNFIVSPACQLPSLERLVGDVRILTANSKFFNEISKQSRYSSVRHFPRLRLESPIDPCISVPKTASSRLRFGMHSLPNRSKWNAEYPELVRRINHRFPEAAEWHFMGMPEALEEHLPKAGAQTLRAFACDTAQFLRSVDVFVFFADWSREEAWARSVAEAIMSGCPVIATNRGGNVDQIVHGNTGFLCNSLAELEEACAMLVKDSKLFSAMRKNAKVFAQSFSSDAVAHRLVGFLQ